MSRNTNENPTFVSADSRLEGAGAAELNIEARVAEGRKHRKRLQNRLNQRSRRLRQREQSAAQLISKQGRPYRVDRWRLDEEQTPTRPPRTTVSKSNDGNPDQCLMDLQVVIEDWDSRLTANAKALSYRHSAEPSLPADHLLRLIRYNVFRGMFANKRMLDLLAIAFLPGTGQTVSLMSDEGFGASLVIHPIASAIPACLTPTELQRSLPHSTWINFLPFPKMRDNLIRWEAMFSHREFSNDLIGNHFVGGDWFHGKRLRKNPPSPSTSWTLMSADEVDAAQTGLVIWGEPHLPQNWEATLGFLRKWSWTVQGCDELIESSNHWRRIRGEEPFCLEMDRRKTV